MTGQTHETTSLIADPGLSVEGVTAGIDRGDHAGLGKAFGVTGCGIVVLVLARVSADSSLL
jgi:hypothetical protein